MEILTPPNKPKNMDQWNKIIDSFKKEFGLTETDILMMPFVSLENIKKIMKKTTAQNV